MTASVTEECVVLGVYLNRLIRPTTHAGDAPPLEGKQGDLGSFGSMTSLA